MTARLRIARATPEDFGTILGLIDDAREYLQTKGTKQWTTPWPTRELRDAKVINGLVGGKTWIVWDDDTPLLTAAAAVTVATVANPAVWPESVCAREWGNPPEQRAVYLHRIVTARKYAGGGLGSDLIDWAGKLAASQYGAECIRIDVWRDNAGLHEYYLKRGFIPCGVCADKDYPSGALFEKPVSRIYEDFTPQFAVSADPFLT